MFLLGSISVMSLFPFAVFPFSLQSIDRLETQSRASSARAAVCSQRNRPAWATDACRSRSPRDGWSSTSTSRCVSSEGSYASKVSPASPDDLRLRGVPAHDHRRPAVHRLEDRQAEALVERWEDERGTVPVKQPQRLVGDPVQQQE